MKKIMAVLAVVALAGCQTNQGQKGTLGTLLGAGLGGWAGSNVGKGKGQLVGVAVGVLAGAMIGKNIGDSLDKVDRMAMQRTTQKSLETSPVHQPVAWSNPDTGNYGTTTPTKTYKRWNGTQQEYCREYQQTITVGGKTQTAYGTACRKPDGQWVIKN